MAATGKPNPTLDLYVGLMNEVKIRFHAIDNAIRGGMSFLPGPIVQEFGFLQLRMVCEVLSLACLVAHGDIKATKAPKLMKEYAADKIMAELDKLHARFFPRPVVVTTIPEGFNIEEIRSEKALSKNEFGRLYGRCGAYLHRGNAKKLLSAKTPLQTNFPELAKWRDKIIALLDHHHIASFDNRHHIVCHMMPLGQPVNAAFAETQLLFEGPSGDHSGTSLKSSDRP